MGDQTASHHLPTSGRVKLLLKKKTKKNGDTSPAGPSFNAVLGRYGRRVLPSDNAGADAEGIAARAAERWSSTGRPGGRHHGTLRPVHGAGRPPPIEADADRQKRRFAHVPAQ